MPYKEVCGFKNQIHVCKFKEEDCLPEKCDMYNIEFTSKAVLEIFRKEQAKVKEINDKMEVFRLAKNTNNPEFKELKKELVDKCYGCAYLSKTYVHLKRIRK